MGSCLAYDVRQDVRMRAGIPLRLQPDAVFPAGHAVDIDAPTNSQAPQFPTSNTPTTRSKTKHKKSGESKPDRNPKKPPPKHPPTPEISPCSSRAPSPALSSSSRPPSPAPSNRDEPEYKYIIREIPAEFATQKTFYSLMATTIKQLSFSSITITLANRRSPGQKPTPNTPTFSVDEIPIRCPTLSICPRSFQFGHGLTKCTNKPICPNCPASHPPNKCPAKEPSCPSCNGPPSSMVMLVPQIQGGRSDRQHVLPVKIVNPASEVAKPSDPATNPTESEPHIGVIRGLIAFVTKTLSDLFPMQRTKIQAILEKHQKPFSTSTPNSPKHPHTAPREPPRAPPHPICRKHHSAEIFKFQISDDQGRGLGVTGTAAAAIPATTT
ncbi:hypothetical protein GEV33_006478 [Tenebrio molitor]|uniref:Uncharacterized protein n=1 Tax=Tenebrio molitor TaxID=7067 RepID=A0A8J6HL67_TENMO|nr:hypothetical protein GEV33_006478 [Tenebrio molitor]